MKGAWMKLKPENLAEGNTGVNSRRGESEMKKLAWIERPDGGRGVLILVTVERRLEVELNRGQVQGLDGNTSRQLMTAARQRLDSRLSLKRE